MPNSFVVPGSPFSVHHRLKLRPIYRVVDSCTYPQLYKWLGALVTQPGEAAKPRFTCRYFLVDYDGVVYFHPLSSSYVHALLYKVMLQLLCPKTV